MFSFADTRSLQEGQNQLQETKAPASNSTENKPAKDPPTPPPPIHVFLVLSDQAQMPLSEAPAESFKGTQSLSLLKAQKYPCFFSDA